MFDEKSEKYISSVLCIVFFLFMTVYEQNKMFSDVDSGPTSIFALALFIIALLTLTKGGLWYRNDIGKAFALYLIPVYILSLMHGLFVPLGSMMTHLTIIMPYLFFVFAYQIIHGLNKISFLFVCAVLMFAYLSFYFLNNNSLNMVKEFTHQTSASYIVLFMLPFALCSKKRLLHYVCFVSTFIIMLISLKRGGLIALGLGFVLYSISSRKKEIDLKSVLLYSISMLLIVFVGVSLYNYVNSALSNSITARFAGDLTGSGRSNIYANAIDMIQQSNAFEFIFGHGWCSFEKYYIGHMPAHNDFLEILFDQGLLCGLFYVLFCCSIVHFAIKMSKLKSFYAPAMWTSLGIFFVNSSISHVLIYEHFFMIFGLFWGCIVAVFEKEQVESALMRNTL